MTAPGPSVTPPADNRTRIPVTVGGEVVHGPDGTPWVQLRMSIGLTQIAMQMPEATAEDLVPLMVRVLTEGAAHARRARLGLVVPTPGQVQLPSNGQPGG